MSPEAIPPQDRDEGEHRLGGSPQSVSDLLAASRGALKYKGRRGGRPTTHR